MSNRYTPEPPTSGKVILNTTMGPIHVELWTKEAPLASRNFIQLSLEGYFDNQGFYRIIPGFLVQSGDPEETGEGGESIYGSSFSDEFHSRLKFSHRGILAMASTRRNFNRTAFFFTLDSAPELNSQHTIFGKVPNDTIYNLLRIGESEVDKNDRPLTMPRILSTEVVINPFDDMIPREIKKNSRVVEEVKPNNKAILAGQFLSFDNDIEENPQMLVKKPASPKETIKVKPKLPVETPEVTIPEFSVGNFKVSTENKRIKIEQKKEDPEEEYNHLKSELALQLKKRPRGSNNPFDIQEIKDEETFLSPLELRRYKFHQNRVKTKGREKNTVSKLSGFVEKIKHQETNPAWMKHKLKFSVDSTKAYNYKTESITKLNQVDDDVVVDPTKKMRRYEENEGYSTIQEIASMENLIEITKNK